MHEVLEDDSLEVLSFYQSIFPAIIYLIISSCIYVIRCFLQFNTSSWAYALPLINLTQLDF
jgi:hypothetical protein